MLARRFLLMSLALAALSLLGGCGEFDDWRGTQRADTIEAYQTFLARNPQSQYAPVAQRRLAELAEQRDWLAATAADNAEAYRSFINTHPKGRWTREARLRLQNFLATPGVIGPAALEPVEPSPSAAAPPLRTGPAGAAGSVASPAPPGAAPAITHRIQLGAFSSRDKAQQAWREARALHAELQGLVAEIVTNSDAEVEVFRLQASVVSEARAREVCRVLQSAGQGCVYVLPGR